MFTLYAYIIIKVAIFLAIIVAIFKIKDYKKEAHAKKQQELREYFYGDKDTPPPLDILK